MLTPMALHNVRLILFCMAQALVAICFAALAIAHRDNPIGRGAYTGLATGMALGTAITLWVSGAA